MSSSFPDRWRLCAMLAIVLMLHPEQGDAQQFYLQPEITGRSEYHSNRNFATDLDEREATAGFRATVQILGAYRTPTGETSVRPRIAFQRYPGRRDLQRSEQFLDFRTNHRTARSEWDIGAALSRRDSYTAELVEAEFDDFLPDDPALGETGRLVGANTRTRLRFRPAYDYRFTERTSGGLRAEYETRRFKSDFEREQVGFDQRQFGATLSHLLDARTQLSLITFVSKFESQDNVNRTDGYGIGAGWHRDWSELLQWGVSGVVERSRAEVRGVVEAPSQAGVGGSVADRSQPQGGESLRGRGQAGFREGIGEDPQAEDMTGTTGRETQTLVGLELTGRLDRADDRLRFSMGRIFHPASGGSRHVTHQIRLQYDRDVHHRLSMRTAARLFRTASQGGFGGNNDRDYARLDLSVRWALTETWFVGGGYSFVWQQYEREPGSAANNTLFFDFGYRGLGAPQ